MVYLNDQVHVTKQAVHVHTNILTKSTFLHYFTLHLNRNAQVQVWLAPLPFHSCVGNIADRGQWEQGCSRLMATDLGPVKATRKKNVLHGNTTTVIQNMIWHDQF